MMLDALLKTVIRHGRLTVIGPDGTSRTYGAGDGSVSHPAIRIHHRSVLLRAAIDPSLGFAEAYMDGRITIERGDVYDVCMVVVRNFELVGLSGLARLKSALRGWLRPFEQRNLARASRRNVAHHYDLSGALYDLFLDADRQYSCAYFTRPDMTLEQAQAAKKAHIARKLRLEPGMRVLDIGSGWGGLALTLARDYGADVTGITLSTEQLALARQRAAQAGLADRVKFELMDYRHVGQSFDRIVSVGMFEHVGIGFYDTYFNKLRTLLKPDGVAMVHTIGRAGPPGPTNSFIAKYIFPGGYTPALSEMMAAVERSGLIAADVEILRLHYAETLKEWRRRFLANRDRAEALYDRRFCRMWELYLAACEASFRVGGQVVFQVQLGHELASLPVTRHYLYPQPVEMPPRMAAQ
ncbi:SAM-dependent methyltransferase [Zavarzinia compransoris]|uniref:SAM-dependent methyltransferase n=1 Tax=Zavarzinia compransoris TaxID=1264899 RepID=A0A317E1P6_9PROT|nr:cyclopropane-fatty-acyl-phospholipid synthase family protein [Zavarzinia compransoris]PWR20056.1 SAM-dependent methyltransferase [Zavarzinia compransoris]TDP44823.1 cyclopropane-fatty-acyl-phospholipid synthase [Zavarzinia compransoris]